MIAGLGSSVGPSWFPSLLQSVLERDQPPPQSVHHGLGARSYAHLAKDIAQVGLYSAHTYRELSGDVTVGHAPSRKSQDFKLALGNLVEAVLTANSLLRLGEAIDHRCDATARRLLMWRRLREERTALRPGLEPRKTTGWCG